MHKTGFIPYNKWIGRYTECLTEDKQEFCMGKHMCVALSETHGILYMLKKQNSTSNTSVCKF